MTPIFFYGSLRDRDLCEVVLARPVPESAFRPARAHGYATLRAIDEAYPFLLPAPGVVAEGVLLADASETDVARLAFFEEAEYALAPIHVETEDGTVEAWHFRGTDKRAASAVPWDFAVWQARDKPVAVEAARELMELFGHVPVERVDDHWPGIMVRARQRVFAAAEPLPDPAGLRTRFDASDVELRARSRPYSGFLAVEEIELRHRRFDGGWSDRLRRSAVLWGDAVTVLPYDPARDRVALIEQFRAGPAARGDACPWCLEVVAGRLDAEEGPEETARREAREEAGLVLGRLWPAGRYYTTPGLAAETITGFVGEAELPEEGPLGLHGTSTEHEDIRAFVLALDAALAAASRGDVNTGPGLVALLWLAAHRAEIRAAWSGAGEAGAAAEG